MSNELTPSEEQEMWGPNEEDEGERVYRSHPKYEVCPICNGEGKYVNPSIDSQGLTEEDFLEQGDDFREDYFRGTYDVLCRCCEGKRVVTQEEFAAYQDQLDDHRVRMMEDGQYDGLYDGRL